MGSKRCLLVLHKTDLIYEIWRYKSILIVGFNRYLLWELVGEGVSHATERASGSWVVYAIIGKVVIG